MDWEGRMGSAVIGTGVLILLFYYNYVSITGIKKVFLCIIFQKLIALNHNLEMIFLV